LYIGNLGFFMAGAYQVVDSVDGVGQGQAGGSPSSGGVRSLRSHTLGGTFNALVTAGLEPHAPQDLRATPMDAADHAAWQRLVSLDTALSVAELDRQVGTLAVAYDNIRAGRAGMTGPRASI
jgi:hypothetical protein